MIAEIEVTRDGAVQVIRLNRPGKKNALTVAMYAAMTAALGEAMADAAIAVTVFAGHPGIFCAGNDIADFLAANQGDVSSLSAAQFIYALAAHEKPMLAAVDGAAVGLGTTLVFHCDLVYASPRSVFQTPFVTLGLVPEAASSLLAPSVMGFARAFELLVMGEPFSAERAREAGLVNAVVPSEEVEAVALKAAHRLAKLPQEAVRLSRKLMKADTSALKQRMDEELQIFVERLKSDEASTAFQAFLAKTAK